MRKVVLSLIVLVLSGVLTSCAVPGMEPVAGANPLPGAWSGPLRGDVRVTGVLPRSNSDDQVIANPRTIAGAVTHIGAFPIVTDGIGGAVDGAGFTEVDSSGEFELNLPSSENYVLLLINENADTREHVVVGYIAVIDGTETVVQFPTEFALSDFDLGELAHDSESGDAVSDATLAVELDEDTLGVWARVDDVVKSIQNYYLNYDPQTGTYYRFVTSFRWHTEPYPTDVTIRPEQLEYEGFNLDIFTSAITEDDFYSYADRSRWIALYAPVPFTNKDGLYYPEGVPISNAPHPDSTVTPTVNDLWFSDEDLQLDHPSVYGDFSFSCWTAFDTSTVLPGYWYLMEGETLDPQSMNELAAFDLGASSPFDADGNARIFLPSLEIQTADGTEISDFVVEWFQYTPDDQAYVSVPADTVARYVGSARLHLTDWNDGSFSGTRIDEGFDVFTEDYAGLGSTWYVGSYPDEYNREAQSITLSYEVLGTTYSFGYRP